MIDIHDASELGASVLTNTKIDGRTTDVQPATAYQCELTVGIDGVSYTAVFAESRHLKPTDVAAGGMISARIDGNKLVIRTLPVKS